MRTSTRNRSYGKVPNRSHRAEENKFEVKNALEASIAISFPGADSLLLPLVFVDGIAGSVVRPQAVKLSFALRGPQASKVWEFGMSASSQVRKKAVPWADSPNPWKLRIFGICSILPLLSEEKGNNLVIFSWSRWVLLTWRKICSGWNAIVLFIHFNAAVSGSAQFGGTATS